MGTIKLTNINKAYGQTRACANIDLHIKEGEFFTLLGPSGCGKTTLLRMVAGLISPDEGRIHIGDHDVTHLPCEKRSVGMVFQNYALFPFMTVYENIEYSLKIRKLSKKEARERVGKYLSMVELAGYENRQISELSGGEQQRIALARSLAMEPKVLLLDEPLSNLDARLRASMRLEIVRIIRNLGITTLFVTHDQTEALSMSDRIAVLHKGQCLQVGSPEEIYNQPQNAFVAQFVGDTNLWTGDELIQNPALVECLGLDPRTLDPGNLLSIRPQNITLHTPAPNTMNTGIIEAIYFTGTLREYQVRAGQEVVKVTMPNIQTGTLPLGVGDLVQLSVAPDSAIFLKA